METTLAKKDSQQAGKRRAVIYLDRGIFRRVRDEHVERDIPVSHVVEEILARHYRCGPAAGPVAG